MADPTLPPGFTLDQPGKASAATSAAPGSGPPAKDTTLPPGFTLDQPAKKTGDSAAASDPSGPPTDEGILGYTAAVERGIAPPLAAAGTGALIGSVVPGVGTAFGAGMGLLAYGGTQAVMGIYNMLAPHLGWKQTVTPDEATEKVLDHLGVDRPANAAQRITEATAGAVADTSGTIRSATKLATSLAPSTTKRVVEALAEHPTGQKIAAGTGAATQQTATEAGVDPTTAWALGLLSPFGVSAANRWIPHMAPGVPRDAAKIANENGFILPPGAASEHPGAVGTALAGTGGKVKIGQEMSAHNQDRVNVLARRDLGLPDDAPLDDAQFDRIRHQYGQVYAEAGRSVPFISPHEENPALPAHGPHEPVPDIPQRGRPPGGPISPISPRYPGTRLGSFQQDLIDIANGPGAALRRELPEAANVPGINRLLHQLGNARSMSPEAWIQWAQKLRSDARDLFLGQVRPGARWQAMAYKRAAEAIEDLVDRQLTRIDQPGFQDRLSFARERIAKAHDVQIATRNGDVEPRRLSGLRSRNITSNASRRRLSGHLETIANMYDAFPRDFQRPTATPEGLSVIDMMIGGHSLAHGNLIGAGLPFLRPISRHILRSPRYQRYQAQGAYTGGNPAATLAITGQGGDTEGQGDLSPYYRSDDYSYFGVPPP